MNYQLTSNKRGLIELGITILPFILLVAVMFANADVNLWVTILLMIPASGFLLRLFVIQHDCGHQSFFKESWLNNWVGRLLGVFTLTPYDYWMHNHAIHHVSSGNLDRRGVGDIDTLTVDEYLGFSLGQRCLYRIYRNPITLFVIGPAYMFFIQHRLPVRAMKKGWIPWASTMGTNLGIIAVSSLVIWQVGLSTFLIVLLPTLLLAATLGIWLFFVQHQFETTIWDQSRDWDRQEAAFYGSSHFDLPPVLRWFTGNIGVHHVHHLNSRIPFYQLGRVISDHPALINVNRITIRESLSLIKLALWDTQSRKMVSFSEALETSK